jgi:KaiC/GvpD/RAD55 family RecA-like ATPase
MSQVPSPPNEGVTAESAGVCRACGGPLQRDELTGLLYCSLCDTYLTRVPEGRTYMLLGDTGSGKSIFIYKLMDLYLRSGKPCVFVALDELPSQLRASIGNLVGGLEESEKDGLLTFVDCYSCMGGVKSNEKYHLDTPGDLNGLALLISKLMNRSAGEPPIRLFIDSTTALFAHGDSDAIVRFLYSMSAKLRSGNGSLFFTLTGGTVSQETQKRMEQLADGLIEFRISETPERVDRFYRFSKVRGTLYFDTWLLFFIGMKTILLAPPLDPETEERFYRTLSLIKAA